MKTNLRLATRPTTARRSHRSRLMLQALEARVVPATITVTDPGDAVGLDGVVTLREAILSANGNANTNNDLVGHVVGTYGSDVVDFDASVFSGVKTITLGGTELTISGALDIQGPVATVYVDAAGASRTFNLTSTAGSVSFSNLHITNGSVTAGFGAGIQSSADTLTLDGCEVISNTASGPGGGIYSAKGAVTISNCSLAYNSSGDSGGSVYVAGGSLKAETTTFNYNLADADGGAVFSLGNINVSGSTFSGNTATNGIGGAIYAAGGSSISDSIFDMSLAGSDGGALYLDNGTHAVTRCDFSNNTAGGSGGAIFQDAATLTVLGTAGTLISGVGFYGNFASGDGGGICDVGGGLDVSELSSQFNHAENGGFVDVSGSTAWLSLKGDDAGGYFFHFDDKAENDGGAVRLSNVSVSHRSLIGNDSIHFIEDEAENGNGGAVAILDGGCVTITGGTGSASALDIISCEAFDASGGGIYVGHLTAASSDVVINNANVHELEGKYGAGVAVYDSTAGVSISDSTIGPAHTAIKHFSTRGGGLEVSGAANGSVSITNTVFSGCYAATASAISIVGSPSAVVFSHCTVTANYYYSGTIPCDLGAGFYLEDAGQVQINDSTITNNPSSVAGGGIYVTGNATATVTKTLTMKGCLVDGNSSADGGGVYLDNTNMAVTVTDTTINGNTVSASGGGITNDASTVTINGCTLSNNNATDFGGGVFLPNSGKATLVNTTIDGNSAGQGGGFGIDGQGAGTSAVTIFNSTISHNTANDATLNQFGGGIWFRNFKAGEQLVLESTIVAENVAVDGGADIYGSPGEALANYSLIGVADNGFTLAGASIGNQNGTLVSPQSAGFDGALGSNGGSTKTLKLLPTSVAFNHGRNLLGLTTDQRSSYPRQSGVRTDIGAYEFTAAPTATVKIDDGSGQRSMIQNLTVTFSTAVTFPSGVAAAFSLTKLATATHPTPTGTVGLSFSVSGSVVTITFSDAVFAPTVIGKSPAGTSNSLIDGVYSFQIIAANVSISGGLFDGDGNGIGGDNFVSQPYVGPGVQFDGEIHRIFGDYNADAVVDLADYVGFRAAYGGTGDTFDYDGNNIVNLTDYVAFRARYGYVL